MSFNPVLTPERLGKENGWDRGPNNALAVEIEHIKSRRERLVLHLRQLLDRRTRGSDRRILNRAERIAGLSAEYQALGSKLISLELL